MTFNLDHTLPTSTNAVTLSQLAAQLATLGMTDPQYAQQLWAALLLTLTPEKLALIRDNLPPTGAIANSVRDQLTEL